MKRTSQVAAGAAARRRPRYFRPRLESYEDRLPLGESMLGLMLGTSLAGVALVTLTANAASAPAQPDVPASGTRADADTADLNRWVSAPTLDPWLVALDASLLSSSRADGSDQPSSRSESNLAADAVEGPAEEAWPWPAGEEDVATGFGGGGLATGSLGGPSPTAGVAGLAPTGNGGGAGGGGAGQGAAASGGAAGSAAPAPPRGAGTDGLSNANFAQGQPGSGADSGPAPAEAGSAAGAARAAAAPAAPTPAAAAGAVSTLTSFQAPAFPQAHATPSLEAPASSDASHSALRESYGKIPLSFEANLGQTDAQVQFMARGSGYALFLTPGEAVLSLQKPAGSESSPAARNSRAAVAGPEADGAASAVLRMQVVGGNVDAPAAGLGELPGRVNYFLGNDPSRWHTDVPTYARVEYQGVYDGIDLAYYGNQNQLEYDFIVAPGADPGAITLGFAGADRLEIDTGGDLVVHAGGGQVRQHQPVIYQDVGGVRQEIAGGYELKDGQQVGFRLGAYDTSRPLVIDPVLVYSTYLGGSGLDLGNGIALDGLGGAYIAGRTSSAANFPTTAGAFDMTYNGGVGDGFVTKLNSAGSALVYSSYLGGSFNDEGFGIAVDAAGSAYVTGLTSSGNFPTTPGAFDTTHNGDNDAFVTKLDPAGSALLYSSYLGSGNTEHGLGIAVDGLGSAYVTGQTLSANFPTTPGAFDTTANGSFDLFVTKLNPAGSALVYSTYLGGSFLDAGSGLQTGLGMAVDGLGSAYVTGRTTSVNFPTTPGAFDTTHNGGSDAFVTKLNPAGSAPLAYSTFLGGSTDDFGVGIAVDASASAYVTGQASSANFPTTPGAFDTTNNGGFDAFVTKLNAAGSAPAYSTYLGGGTFDLGNGIAVDASGSAYVTGRTDSVNFPTTADAFDTTLGGQDAFVTKLNPAGSAPLVYSTYLGGTSREEGRGIALDPSGNAYVAGWTESVNFPTTADAFDTTFNGVSDAFVTKIEFVGPPATLTLDPAADTNPVNTEHCVTATVQDATGNPVPDVTVRFTVSGAVNTSGSATTDTNGQATFCYQGPLLVGADAITAYADTDNDNTQDVGEPAGAATKAWVTGPAATLTLDPAADVNPVGSQHCVTGTVQDAFTNPVAGVTVRFTVTGAVNTGGSATTNTSGQATFCYIGPPLPGADAITAYADTDNDNTQDAGEPAGAATKDWMLPPTTPLVEVKITEGGRITAANGDQATFGGSAKSSESGATEGQQHYRDHGPAQPLNVSSINVLAIVLESPTRASIYGQATIDGSGSFFYRIQVQDLGEPGVGQDTYWILLQTGYNSGEQVLEGGNVQIHKG
jgi:hypothetical protein